MANERPNKKLQPTALRAAAEFQGVRRTNPSPAGGRERNDPRSTLAFRADYIALSPLVRTQWQRCHSVKIAEKIVAFCTQNSKGSDMIGTEVSACC
jgi:hypothetical protein